MVRVDYIKLNTPEIRDDERVFAQWDYYTYVVHRSSFKKWNIE